ncbi:hypothetical protein FACS189421_00280 [Bacteroidia bacterium]|nr:hypothetical protein FACS189421_00280 [Bacteroidia bacterium]GHT06977.1 hypothetical protein FACS189423_11800 [Bacteroidia bacterium]GHT47506.1 hypothetical protein FACS189440_08230 [Bacteroidia bacterium]
MIHNKKQLVIAQKGIETLQERIEAIKDSKDIVDLLQIHAWTRRIEDLSSEIEEFNYLTNTSELEFSKKNLPKAVIGLRIASGMTQKQLADAIEVQEQQIQRYEQNLYRKTSFERVVQILRVLSHNIELKVIPKREQQPIEDNRFDAIYAMYSMIIQLEQIVKGRNGLIEIQR